jgi:GT2 family glycosyltransferase
VKNLHIKPQISIIIVSYNCWDYLKDCLKSLALINVPYEAIVVDNASGDETVLNLKQQFPEVKTIVNDYNAGFSRANNQGFTIASGEVVLFTC